MNTDPDPKDAKCHILEPADDLLPTRQKDRNFYRLSFTVFPSALTRSQTSVLRLLFTVYSVRPIARRRWIILRTHVPLGSWTYSSWSRQPEGVKVDGADAAEVLSRRRILEGDR